MFSFEVWRIRNGALFLFVNPCKIRKNKNNLKKVINKFALYIIYDIYLYSDNKEVITNLKRGGNSEIRQNIMKTLIKKNELGKVTKAFYNNEQSAKDAAGSFLNDCTIHGLEREKRTIEIIDFEFEKYGFSKMPIFAQYEVNNLGLFVKAVFQGLGNQRFTTINQVTEL